MGICAMIILLNHRMTIPVQFLTSWAVFASGATAAAAFHLHLDKKGRLTVNVMARNPNQANYCKLCLQPVARSFGINLVSTSTMNLR